MCLDEVDSPTFINRENGPIGMRSMSARLSCSGGFSPMSLGTGFCLLDHNEHVII